MFVPKHKPKTPSDTPRAPGSSACTVSARHKYNRAIAKLLYPEAFQDYWRPQTRGDCAKVPRPCPYIGCRYSTYLDVTEHGSLKYNHPGEQPWQIPADQSCALDIADGPELTLERTGQVLNFTRERTRQVQEAVYEYVRGGIVHLRILAEDEPEPPRPLPDRSPSPHE